MSEQQNNQRPKSISLFEKWQEEMALIERRTGIKGIYVVIALIICVILVYKNIFDTVITNLVGTLYPAFWTIKCIEKGNAKEQNFWLTYWAVFGFFILIDMFSPIIVKFVPFYLFAKIIFLIWMFMPGSMGCKVIYKNVVKRIVKKIYEKWEGDLRPLVGIFQYDDDSKANVRINNNYMRMASINRTVLEIDRNEQNNQQRENIEEIKEENESNINFSNIDNQDKEKKD